MKKINNKNYDIYYYQSNKFKTIDLKFVFGKKVSSRDLIYLNTLMNVLVHSSKKYPTNRDLSIELQELYDLYLGSSVIRCNNRLLGIFDLSFINPIYTNKKYFKLSIEFLKEIVFNPKVNNNKFDKEVVSLVIDQIKNDIMYSYYYPQGMVNEELYGSVDGNINVTLYQNKDILDDINEENLYEYYLDFINNSEVKLFITGNLDNNMIKELCNINIVSKDIKFEDNKIVSVSDNKINYIKGSYNQNKIAYLLKFDHSSFFEYFYVSTIFNYIYGGLQDSLLMTNVRERDSLVYYIDSYLRKVDHVIMLNAGFSRENTKKVIKGIKDNLDLIRKGEFNDNLIDKAKEIITIDLLDYEKVPVSILNYMIGRVYILDLDNKDKINEYMKVTKKDIINFANKIDLCKIMVLEGNDEEEA